MGLLCGHPHTNGFVHYTSRGMSLCLYGMLPPSRILNKCGCKWKWRTLTVFAAVYVKDHLKVYRPYLTSARKGTVKVQSEMCVWEKMHHPYIWFQFGKVMWCGHLDNDDISKRFQGSTKSVIFGQNTKTQWRLIWNNYCASSQTDIMTNPVN